MNGQQRLQGQLSGVLAKVLQTGTAQRIPEAGGLAWRWFAELSSARSYHASGPNPISYGEIDAYARLHHWPLQTRHVDLIIALDRSWLDHAYRQNDKPTDGVKVLSRPSGQPVNAAVFDAVFG